MSNEMKERLAEKLRVTAHREAGHAVAAVMVGSVEQLSISDGKDSSKWGNARSTMLCMVGQRGFNTFAGPWADARAQWPEGVPLDHLDRDGRTFSQCVAQAFARDHYEESICDADYEQLDLPELDELGVGVDLYGTDLESYLWIWIWEQSGDAAERATVEAEWCAELEQVWPIIQALATELLAVRNMDGDAVHGLVEPMLEALEEVSA